MALIVHEDLKKIPGWDQVEKLGNRRLAASEFADYHVIIRPATAEEEEEMRKQLEEDDMDLMNIHDLFSANHDPDKLTFELILGPPDPILGYQEDLEDPELFVNAIIIDVMEQHIWGE